MSDIVERLRGADGGYFMRKMFTESADEIERLRAELVSKTEGLAAMRQQRDEARIRVCELCARMGGVYRRINREVVECKTPEEIAEVCGWDCFAKEGGGA